MPGANIARASAARMAASATIPLKSSRRRLPGPIERAAGALGLRLAWAEILYYKQG
jgi:hypothetical protein